MGASRVRMSGREGQGRAGSEWATGLGWRGQGVGQYPGADGRIRTLAGLRGLCFGHIHGKASRQALVNGRCGWWHSFANSFIQGLYTECLQCRALFRTHSAVNKTENTSAVGSLHSKRGRPKITLHIAAALECLVSEPLYILKKSLRPSKNFC